MGDVSGGSIKNAPSLFSLFLRVVDVIAAFVVVVVVVVGDVVVVVAAYSANVGSLANDAIVDDMVVTYVFEDMVGSVVGGMWWCVWWCDWCGGLVVWLVVWLMMWLVAKVVVWMVGGVMVRWNDGLTHF